MDVKSQDTVDAYCAGDKQRGERHEAIGSGEQIEVLGLKDDCGSDD